MIMEKLPMKASGIETSSMEEEKCITMLQKLSKDPLITRT